MLTNALFAVIAGTVLAQIWYLLKAYTSKRENYWISFFTIALAAGLSCYISFVFITDTTSYETVGLGVSGMMQSLILTLGIIAIFLVALIGGILRFATYKGKQVIHCTNNKERLYSFLTIFIITIMIWIGGTFVQHYAVLNGELNVSKQAEKTLDRYLKENYGKDNYHVYYFGERSDYNNEGFYEVVGYNATVEIFEPYKTCTMHVDGKTAKELTITRDDCKNNW